MVFNSYAFATFFAVLFPAYWLLARWPRAQNVLLLGAAYYFYSKCDVGHGRRTPGSSRC